MRNLTKTLAIISLLTPVVGYPLGIGDLKLHSALNQNLNAEIPLTLSAGEDAKDIKVTLAPAAKFDEAGVPWTYFLSKIRFQVVNAKGSAVIRVSSSEALKEPFLNLLVEVSWPKGNLFREFTVLVDPPASYKQSLPIAPSEVSKPAVVTSAPPVNTGKVSAPVATVNKAPVAVTAVNNKAPVFTPSSATSPALANPVVTNAVPAESGSSKTSSYGPIHKKETMWSIGVKFGKERGVSVEQMLMAVYEANPGAFNRNNVFGLVSGAVLDIPGKEVAERLSPEEAREAYAQQKKAWKSGATLPDYTSTIAEKEEVSKPVEATKPLPLAPAPAPSVTPNVPAGSGKSALSFSGDGQKKISTEPLKVPQTTPQAQVPTVVPQKTPEVAREVATSPSAPLKLPEVEKEPEVSPTDAELLKRVAILEKQLKVTKKALAEKETILKQTQTSSTEQTEKASSTPLATIAPAEPVKPVTPVEAAKPVVPAEPVKPVTPVEAAKPVVPAEPVKPVTPVEAAKPVVPAEPVKPVTPVEAAKPVAPTPAVGLKTVDLPASFQPIGDFAKLVAPQSSTPVEVLKPVAAPVAVETLNPVVLAAGAVKPTVPLEVVKPTAPVEALKPVEPAKPVTPVEAAKPVAPTTEPVKPVVPTEAAKPVTPAPVPAPQVVKPVAPAPVVQPVIPDEEPGLMELVASNSEYVGGAAGGLVVLGFVGWWLRNRKRAMEEPMFPISPKVEFKGISTADTSVVEDNNLNVAFNASEFQGKSIFEPDWNIDIETEQTEIDPISEADVYLAYARYQQAEELMRDAIKEQPNRDECKLKLLEIFYASENKDAFVAYADELAKAGKKADGDFWEKVMEMGGEICPGSVLFTPGADDDSEVGKKVAPAKPDSSVGAEQLKPSETHAPKGGTHDVVSSLDNLSEFDDFDDEVPVGRQQKTDIDNSVSPPNDEDDFDTFDFDEGGKPAVVALAKDDTDTFDFDDFAMDETPVVAPVVEAVKEDMETFDFDDFAMDDKPVVAPVVEAVKEDMETFDFDDFAMDDKPVVAPVVEAVKEDLETFDFNDFAMDDKPVVAPVVEAVKEDLETFDFDDFAMDDKPVVAPVVEAVKEDLETFDFDDFAMDDKPVVAPVVEAVKEDLETFDFDDFAMDDKPVVAPVVEAVKEDLETFDFDDFAMDDKPVVAPVVEAVKEDLETFDFDDFAMDDKPVVAKAIKDDLETFDFDDFVVPNKTVVEPVIAVKDGLENFEFDDFIAENKKTDTIPPAVEIDVKEDQEIFDFDTSSDNAEDQQFVNTSSETTDFDFDFDFDMPGTGLEGQGNNFGVADLGNMDDLGTKLDIAKAYIEMGETEAARDITEEIIKNGTAEQKKTAESLLERLK